MVGGIKDMKTIKVVAAVICDNIKVQFTRDYTG